MREGHERAQEKCMPRPHYDIITFAKRTSHPLIFAIEVCHAKQRHEHTVNSIYAVNSGTSLNSLTSHTHAIKILPLRMRTSNRTRARTLLLWFTKHALQVLSQVRVFEGCCSNQLFLNFCSLDSSFQIHSTVQRLRLCRCIVIQLHDVNVLVGKELGNLRRPVVRFATVIY